MKIREEEINEFLNQQLPFPVEMKDSDGTVRCWAENKEGDAIRITWHVPFSLKDCMKKGVSMYLGEAYMDGLVDVEGENRPLERLVEFAYEMMLKLQQNATWTKWVSTTMKVKQKFHHHTPSENKEEIHAHYDISNDFYRLWLDDTMTYSCAYFANEKDTLTQAQENKVQHILKKLNPKPGKTLVDIGCGWGTLMLTACEQYQLKVTGITLSEEQYNYVQEQIEKRNLQDRAEVLLMDYRNLKGRHFDYVTSVGMFEHVGSQELPNYFQIVSDLLSEGGNALIHGITSQQNGGTDPWLDKYIFPGGYIPSMVEILEDTRSAGLQLFDLETLRRHYQKTLECWTDNFHQCKDEVLKMEGERFYRMWDAYLQACAGSFAAGNIDCCQYLLTKGPSGTNLPMTREYMYHNINIQ